MGALFRVQWRSFLRRFSQPARSQKAGKKRKPRSKGFVIGLWIFLAVWLELVLTIFWFAMFPLLEMGYNWLFFSLAGLAALALAVIGSAFLTQATLYDAKDNELLLAMPIPPWRILLVRMLTLLLYTLMFVAGVLLPACVVSVIITGFRFWQPMVWLLLILSLTLFAQALCCVLGWFLRQLLLRLKNKAVASLFGMVLFLIVYFAAYNGMMQGIEDIGAHAEDLSAALGGFAPAVVIGRAFCGDVLCFLAVVLVSCALFAAVVWFLAKTFSGSLEPKRRASAAKPEKREERVRSTVNALVRRERKRFLRSPSYLTNLGFGLILLPVLPVAALVFRGTILGVLEQPEVAAILSPFIAPICAVLLGFILLTTPLTAPSVSLEGKTLWLLRSLPVTGRDVIRGKMRFHLLFTAPLAVLSAAVLALSLGCGPVDTLLLAVFAASLSACVGYFGMALGLRFARFDWTNESWPCKQSGAMTASILGGYALLILLIGIFFLLTLALSLPVSVSFAVCDALLVLLAFSGYRLVYGWGVQTFESF